MNAIRQRRTLQGRLFAWLLPARATRPHSVSTEGYTCSEAIGTNDTPRSQRVCGPALLSQILISLLVTACARSQEIHVSEGSMAAAELRASLQRRGDPTSPSMDDWIARVANATSNEELEVAYGGLNAELRQAGLSATVSFDVLRPHSPEPNGAIVQYQAVGLEVTDSTSIVDDVVIPCGVYHIWVERNSAPTSPARRSAPRTRIFASKRIPIQEGVGK